MEYQLSYFDKWTRFVQILKELFQLYDFKLKSFSTTNQSSIFASKSEALIRISFKSNQIFIATKHSL